MIGIHCTISTKAGQTRVKLIAQGSAATEFEELYNQTLRQAIQTGLEVAHSKEQQILAKLTAAPAEPLSPDAVVINASFKPEGSQPAPALPPCFSPRPPLLSEFIQGLIRMLKPAPPPEHVREQLGQLVREEWIRWAKDQPDPKPSWLAPWEQLTEPMREADRRIGEAILMKSLTQAREIVHLECQDFMARVVAQAQSGKQGDTSPHGQN